MTGTLPPWGGHRRRWTPDAPPEVPSDLRPYAPANPQWTASTDIDREIAGAAHVFKLDQGSGTLFFTHTTS